MGVHNMSKLQILGVVFPTAWFIDYSHINLRDSINTPSFQFSSVPTSTKKLLGIGPNSIDFAGGFGCQTH